MLWSLYAVGAVAVAVRPRSIGNIILPLFRHRFLRRRLARVFCIGKLSATGECEPALPRRVDVLTCIELGKAIQIFSSSPPRSRRRFDAQACIAELLSVRAPSRKVSPSAITADVVESIQSSAKLRSHCGIAAVTAISRIFAPLGWVAIIGKAVQGVTKLFFSVWSETSRSSYRLVKLILFLSYYFALHLTASGVQCQLPPALGHLLALGGTGTACACMIVEEIAKAHFARGGRRQDLAPQDNTQPDHAEGYESTRVSKVLRARRWARIKCSLFVTIVTTSSAISHCSRVLGILSCGALYAALWPADFSPYIFGASRPNLLRMLLPSMGMWTFKTQVGQLVRGSNGKYAFFAHLQVFDIGLTIFGPMAFNVVSRYRASSDAMRYFLLLLQLSAGATMRNNETCLTAISFVLYYLVCQIASATNYSKVVFSIFTIFVSSLLSHDVSTAKFLRILETLFCIDGRQVNDPAVSS